MTLEPMDAEDHPLELIDPVTLKSGGNSTIYVAMDLLLNIVFKYNSGIA